MACARPVPHGDITIARTDTLVAPNSSVLIRPAELALDDNGLVYIADLGVNSVVVVDSLGALRASIGSEGAGPGELASPRALQPGRDTLRLLDSGNGRFELFTLSGQFIRTTPAPASTLIGPVAIGPDGAAVVGLGGQDNALAQRVLASGEVSSRFGTPIVPVPEVWDFTAIKQEIREGRVPGQLRNHTFPVLGPNGRVWLCLSAEGVIERYSARDSLVWRVQLDEPDFAAIREDFFHRNRADSAGNRLYSLSLFVGGQSVGEDLWLLVRQPASAETLFLILAPSGAVRARIRLPGTEGIRGFAVDPVRRFLYLLAYDDAALLRTSIPEGVLGQPN